MDFGLDSPFFLEIGRDTASVFSTQVLPHVVAAEVDSVDAVAAVAAEVVDLEAAVVAVEVAAVAAVELPEAVVAPVVVAEEVAEVAVEAPASEPSSLSLTVTKACSSLAARKTLWLP